MMEHVQVFAPRLLFMQASSSKTDRDLDQWINRGTIALCRRPPEAVVGGYHWPKPSVPSFVGMRLLLIDMMGFP